MYRQARRGQGPAPGAIAFLRRGPSSHTRPLSPNRQLRQQMGPRHSHWPAPHQRRTLRPTHCASMAWSSKMPCEKSIRNRCASWRCKVAKSTFSTSQWYTPSPWQRRKRPNRAALLQGCYVRARACRAMPSRETAAATAKVSVRPGCAPGLWHASAVRSLLRRRTMRAANSATIPKSNFRINSGCSARQTCAGSRSFKSKP